MRLFVPAAVPLFALVLASSAFASPVTAVGGFSATTAGQGAPGWYYGTGTPSAFTPFSYTGTDWYGVTGTSYQANAQNSFLLVGYDPAGVSLGDIQVPGDELFMEPGSDDGTDAIVEFEVSSSGWYTIQGSFTGRDHSSLSIGESVGVYIDGVALDAGSLSGAYENSFTFNDRVFLNAGQNIQFDAAALHNNNSNDSTGFKASIEAVAPEPSSLALMGTGLAGLAAIARRRLLARS